MRADHRDWASHSRSPCDSESLLPLQDVVAARLIVCHPVQLDKQVLVQRVRAKGRKIEIYSAVIVCVHAEPFPNIQQAVAIGIGTDLPANVDSIAAQREVWPATVLRPCEVAAPLAVTGLCLVRWHCHRQALRRPDRHNIRHCPKFR